MANYLFEQFCNRFKRQAPPFSAALLKAFESHDWKGNVRELENRIATYVLLGLGKETEERAAQRHHSGRPAKVRVDGAIPLKGIAERAYLEVEREVILRALQANHWNRRRAAEALKISYRTLLYKIRQAGLHTKGAHLKQGS